MDGFEKQSNEKSKRGGKRPGAGRPAGVPNKMSKSVKENVIDVFERLGGVEHMTEWAYENPTQFYGMYSKLLPLQVNADIESNSFSRIEVCIVDPEV